MGMAPYLSPCERLTPALRPGKPGSTITLTMKFFEQLIRVIENEILLVVGKVRHEGRREQGFANPRIRSEFLAESMHGAPPFLRPRVLEQG